MKSHTFIPEEDWAFLPHIGAPFCLISMQVFSRHAGSMSLVLVRAAQEPDGSFTPAGPASPGSLTGSGYLEVALDPVLNRTGDCWHVCVDGMKIIGSMLYAWRADGPSGRWEGGHLRGLILGKEAVASFLGLLRCDLKSAP